MVRLSSACTAGESFRSAIARSHLVLANRPSGAILKLNHRLQSRAMPHSQRPRPTPRTNSLITPIRTSGKSSPPSTEPPRFGPARLVEILSGRLGQTATFASTEHFNLQTARSITVDAAAALIQRRRRRLVLEGYSPDAIDLAAIFIPEPQQAEAA